METIQFPNNHKMFNMDAWSDGQVRSKMWLCQELELRWQMKGPAHLWIYGAWYGSLAMFLLIRARIPIRRVQLFDIDAEAIEMSKMVLKYWDINRRVDFDFNVLNCDELDFDQHASSDRPDLVINTSCEHFQSFRWFQNLPQGQRFVVQSTNMAHPTHIAKSESLEHFRSELGQVQAIDFAGQLSFRYPHFGFDRYMVIGQK